MKIAEAAHYLSHDFQVVTQHLCLNDYAPIFEEEMQEYFPFSEDLLGWLKELYCSEKYNSLSPSQLSLLFEKDHPFLFMRDLAHMNSWNLGYRSPLRRDHIAGLMFSSNNTFALEATFCLCRPSLIGEKESQWFDFKQAMTQIEKSIDMDFKVQAWKACALFYLYFHLSEGQAIDRQELFELLEPYIESIEIAMYEGTPELKKECTLVTKTLQSQNSKTLLDCFSLQPKD